jgi:hypothetical protein
MAPPEAYISWSPGKDSAWALHLAREGRLAEVAGLLTTVNLFADLVRLRG